MGWFGTDYGWDDFTGDVSGAAKGIGNFLYEATPADNISNIINDFRTGNVGWGTAIDAGWGIAEGVGLLTGIGAIGNVAAKAGAKAAARSALTRIGTQGGISAGASYLLGGEPDKVSAYTPHSGYAAIANQMGSNATGNYGLGVGPMTSKASTSRRYGSADTMERAASARPRMLYGSADTLERRQGVPGPAAVAGQQAAPRNSAGTFAAVASSIGSQLAALSPEMQAQLDEARSQALRDYQLVQAQADMARKSGSLQAQEQLRAAGRAGVGQAADFRQIASELGFGSSPAAYGVGLDEIAARERAARAAAQSEFAALTEQLARQNVSARNTYESVLNRLDQEELASRSQQGLAKLMQSLGG